MKNILIFLLIVGAVYLVATSQHWNLGLGGSPPVIANPVYAVSRFRAELHDRTINLVALAKTFDRADCQSSSADVKDRMESHHYRDGELVWEFVSSECSSVLDSRDLKLFDNQPTFVNYVSASPGASSEREVRLVFWGVTAQEGDLMCGELPRLQDRWHGKVTCIHALASQ